MIGFYHGSSLPVKENLKSGIYFIVEEGNKGKLYRVLADATDAVLVAETNNDTEFATLKAAVEQAQKDIQANATSVAGALASIKKITDAHGETLQNITTEAASIRTLAQGAADQAALNKAAHEKNAEDIETNANAISAIKDGTTIDSFADVESALAGKETAGAAASALAEAKTYAEQQASAVDAAYKAKIGDIAEGTTVKKYVDDAVADVVNSDAFNALEQDVATIKGDYLKAADKTELEGKINLKADQTALTEEVNRAKGEEARIEGLVGAEETRAKGEEARIEGLVTAEAAKAREEEGKLSDRLDEVEAFFKTTEEEKLDEALDTLVELQKYLETEGAAADKMVLDIKANADAIDAIEADYLKAADKTELSGAIDGVAGRMTTAEGKISALEAKFGEGEGSVEDMIADAIAAEKAEREAGDQAAEASAAAALAAAQEADRKAVAAQGEVDALEGTVATLSGVVDTKAAAADLTALEGRVTTAEGKITTLEGEMDAAEGRLDAVEKKASDNAAAIGTNTSNIEALMAALEWKQA